MCEPMSILAAVAIGSSAVSTGMQAVGTYKAGQTAKQQATLDAARADQQAQLANFNAGQIERYGKLNSDLVLAVSGINTGLTTAIAGINTDLINATTDFNTGIIGATTDFNVSSAEGAARLLEARGDLQAQAREANADVLELQAQDTLEAGNQAERQSRAAYANLKSQQRVRLAANGVALDEGSALRIQSDTDYVSDVDADTIRTNALKAAMGYRVSAVNERAAGRFAALDAKAQAVGKRAEAVAARINGDVGIAQARLSGGIRALDTKLTASYQILQNEMNAQIESLNITRQAESDAWASRAQALGFQGNAAQARLTAGSINPGFMAATSLVSGAAKLAGQAYGMYG